MLLDGVDVSRRVRDADVTAAASKVSVHPGLRAWMVLAQRAMVREMLGDSQAISPPGGVVMEGRDIGTAVFPDAEVKIFLDAAPEVRGQPALPPRASLCPPFVKETDPASRTTARQALLEEMRERDRRDRTRADSPLRPAEDAVILDSTEMTLDEVLGAAEKIVREHLHGA